MYRPVRSVALIAAFCSSIAVASAQAPRDPSGHWEASVQLQGMTIPLELDLRRDASGGLRGTFSQPAQQLVGLPLRDVAIKDGAVVFTLVSGSTFRGVLGADGATLSGDLVSNSVGTVAIAFSRKGDARIAAPPTSPAIAKELEGTWNGTLDVNGGLRLVLKMTNSADGTSSGTVQSLDEGGLEVPIAIAQKGASVTLELKMLNSSFAGTLNAAGTELTGTYTMPQGMALPLQFRRADAASAKE